MTSTHTSETKTKGRYGAKRQSWEGKSPREIIEKLYDEHGGDEEAILDSFDAVLLTNTEIRRTVGLYYQTNALLSLIKGRANANLDPSSPPRKTMKQMIEEIKVKAGPAVNKRIDHSILYMVMPNGKALKECTGKEIRQYRDKLPSFLDKIISRVKPSQIVGKVISDKELIKLY